MPSRYLGDTDPFSSLCRCLQRSCFLFNTFSHSMSMFEAAPTAACGRAARGTASHESDDKRARLQPCDQCCTEEGTGGPRKNGHRQPRKSP